MTSGAAAFGGSLLAPGDRVPGLGAGDFEREADARGYLDWAGGLLWLEMPDSADAGAQAIRAAVASRGGHATLIRASEAVRSTVDVFQPQAEGLARLSQRLKTGFDPENILNTGRMRAEI